MGHLRFTFNDGSVPIEIGVNQHVYRKFLKPPTVEVPGDYTILYYGGYEHFYLTSVVESVEWISS